MRWRIGYLLLTLVLSALSWGWCQGAAFLFRVVWEQEDWDSLNRWLIFAVVDWGLILLFLLYGMYWSWKRVWSPAPGEPGAGRGPGPS